MITLKNGRLSDTFWEERGIPHSIADAPVIDIDGTKKWYWRGYISRYGGPAVIEPSGASQWYISGILHRKDGPAVMRPNEPNSWYIYGKRAHDFKEFQKFSKCSDRDIITLKLKYGEINNN